MNTHKAYILTALLFIGSFILLTSSQARGQSPIAVVNAINYLPEVTPDSFAAAFSGSEITTQTASNPAGALNLGGVTAKLDGQPVLLVFVSSFQVNLRIPESVTPGLKKLALAGEAGQTFSGPVTVILHAPRLATRVGTDIAAGFYLDLGNVYGLLFGDGLAVRIINGMPQTGTVKLVFNDGRQFPAFYAGPSGFPLSQLQQVNFGFSPGDLDGEPRARLCVLPDGGVLKCSNTVTLKRW